MRKCDFQFQIVYLIGIISILEIFQEKLFLCYKDCDDSFVFF